MMDKAEVDDDITYLVLVPLMMETYGLDLSTDDVARLGLICFPLRYYAERTPI